MNRKKNSWSNLLILLFTILAILLMVETGFRILSFQRVSSHPDLEQFLGSKGATLSERLSNHSAAEDNSAFRIAMIGDSFILGDGTEKNLSLADSAVPLVLQRQLDSFFGSGRYEVLNFGLKGANTLDESFIIREHVLKYKPDLVILAVSGNDWNFQDYNLDSHLYCDIGGSFRDRILDYLSVKSAVFRYFDESFQMNQRPSRGEKWSFNMRCLNRSISRISSMLNNELIPSFALYIYESYVPEADPENHFGDMEPEKDVVNEMRFFHSCFRSAGLDYIDTYPRLMNLTIREAFSDDQYHFSRKANYMIADVAFGHLIDSGLLVDCRSIGCEFENAKDFG